MTGPNAPIGNGRGISETTGRYLVLFREGSLQEGVDTLTERAGFTVTRSSDFEQGSMPAEVISSSEAIVFDDLAIAVVDDHPDQIRMLGTAVDEAKSIIAIEPERVVYALGSEMSIADPSVNTMRSSPPQRTEANGSLTVPREYLLGYRDGVNHLVEQMLARSTAADQRDAIPSEEIDLHKDITWGLRLTRTAMSPYTGKGVRVAVLDTGMDLGHPDFAGRAITARSFVVGETAQDGHGHGTHCIGTACGPRKPGQLPRYGIACDAEIFVGKVLSNQGSGTDSGILAGIQWAIRNHCAVVSMSLGAPAQPGQRFSEIYETVARRALGYGTLIIAAAGNESRRPESIAPVGHPANCPSIMAVAAVDEQLQIAYFSSGGINIHGGQVDIAGPGVAVYSSWPRPQLYNTISGTSMATPHVAGIAALLSEQNPDVRGGPLGWLLLQSALRLVQASRDVGSGLVQAP